MKIATTTLPEQSQELAALDLNELQQLLGNDQEANTTEELTEEASNLSDILIAGREEDEDDEDEDDEEWDDDEDFDDEEWDDEDDEDWDDEDWNEDDDEDWDDEEWDDEDEEEDNEAE